MLHVGTKSANLTFANTFLFWIGVKLTFFKVYALPEMSLQFSKVHVAFNVYCSRFFYYFELLYVAAACKDLCMSVLSVVSFPQRSVQRGTRVAPMFFLRKPKALSNDSVHADADRYRNTILRLIQMNLGDRNSSCETARLDYKISELLNFFETLESGRRASERSSIL